MIYGAYCWGAFVREVEYGIRGYEISRYEPFDLT